MTNDFATRGYQQFIEYLAEKVKPEDILAFSTSEEDGERIQELLDHNSAGTLTAEEMAQLEQIAEFDDFVSDLKLKALKALKTPQHP
jgi:hypothetical protein